MTPIEVKKNPNKFKSLPHKNYLGKIFFCLPARTNIQSYCKDLRAELSATGLVSWYTCTCTTCTGRAVQLPDRTNKRRLQGIRGRGRPDADGAILICCVSTYIAKKKNTVCRSVINLIYLFFNIVFIS